MKVVMPLFLTVLCSVFIFTVISPSFAEIQINIGSNNGTQQVVNGQTITGQTVVNGQLVTGQTTITGQTTNLLDRRWATPWVRRLAMLLGRRWAILWVRRLAMLLDRRWATLWARRQEIL